VAITELLLDRETIDSSELQSALDLHPDPGSAPIPSIPTRSAGPSPLPLDLPRR
jgi:hypothetical protein